ncbi:MAG: 1-deoxy-D-xylulose-5-phosphate reductoisomerase, partial [Proteobacteria bacterium]|nr:1-deoxy-D-xylulose-5-phosphate reductoisomerase [Pseudomonadota bacterium]
ARFLDDAVPFNAIAASIAHALDTLAGGPADTLDDLLEADRQARHVAGAYLETCA